MSKIRIVNWLLTRKCNLKCDYCAIVKDYSMIPAKYPRIAHYMRNEMSTETVINGLTKFKAHNPDIFHIFYGGEPMLRKDLPDIINFCNKENIHYTIISNNTPAVKPLIQKLLDQTDEVKGFTASVDPVYDEIDSKKDRVRKSIHGLKSLIELKKLIPDVVAEITVMKHNVKNLYPLIQELTDNGINSDVTFIDIAKSMYYDFSNIWDENLLVNRSAELGKQFELIMKNNVDVHMKEILIPAIWDSLPSNMDCEIDKGLHNISVDADGSIRLCLRVRGTFTPNLINLRNLFYNDQVAHFTKMTIHQDKKKYCKLCNHTCQIMSRVIDQENLGPEDLVHLDKREGK